MPEPIRITSLRDLDAAVHRHAMGKGYFPKLAAFMANVPAYSTGPVASFALETKMRELGYVLCASCSRDTYFVTISRERGRHFHGIHASRFVAMELASLAALGVELELIGEWDKC